MVVHFIRLFPRAASSFVSGDDLTSRTASASGGRIRPTVVARFSLLRRRTTLHGIASMGPAEAPLQISSGAFRQQAVV